MIVILLNFTTIITIMPEIEKRKADEYSVVPSKRTRHEISVVGTREKAVVTSAVSIGRASFFRRLVKVCKFYLCVYFAGTPYFKFVCSDNAFRRAPRRNFHIKVPPRREALGFWWF